MQTPFSNLPTTAMPIGQQSALILFLSGEKYRFLSDNTTVNGEENWIPGDRKHRRLVGINPVSKSSQNCISAIWKAVTVSSSIPRENWYALTAVKCLEMRAVLYTARQTPGFFEWMRLRTCLDLFVRKANTESPGRKLGPSHQSDPYVLCLLSWKWEICKDKWGDYWR